MDAMLHLSSTFLPTPHFPDGRCVHPRMEAGIFLGRYGAMLAVYLRMIRLWTVELYTVRSFELSADIRLLNQNNGNTVHIIEELLVRSGNDWR